MTDEGQDTTQEGGIASERDVDTATESESGGGDGTGTETEPGSGAAEDPDGRTTMTYVQWAAFAVLSLLALVATFRFYLATSRAIGIWISPDFEPLFQAGFNLVILAAAAVGLSLLARRLRR